MSRLSFSKSTILRDALSEEKDRISEQHEYYEDRGNWRNIIFLPYKMLWRLLIVTVVLMDCILVTYSLGYKHHRIKSPRWALHYFLEGLYFFDTLLTILHRYMAPYQKTQTHVPKNTYLLLIDVLTLLPYYETYYILQLSSKGMAYGFCADYTIAKIFFRIPNVLLFFYNANNMPGLNHVLVTTILQMVLFYLYNIIVSVIFFKIGNYKGRKWTDNLKYHNFQNSSSFHWFILTNCAIGNVLAHNWSGLIKPENAIEDTIFCSTMILGFLMHIMIFFGQLTALYIKEIADHYEFSSRLYVIAKMLDDWNVPSKTKREAINIYNKFWEKRYGRKEIPPSFYILPKSLRGDCTVDIFWHCFKHSYLFTDMGFPFLKNLSLHMRNEFYMPGEFLHKSNQVKHKMMYIVSGVVEILPEDDKGSSIISFSGGTVLGEISCLMAFKTKVNIRCTTYCEIQTLDLKVLAQLMKKYHGINRQLYSKIRSRFSIAHELQHREILKLKCRNEKRTSVRWMKKQWRSINCSHKRKRLVEDKHKQITVYHTSQYLGLYVLCDEVELKEKFICLRSTCPYLFEPSSSFRGFCDYVVLAAVILQSIFLPYITFFIKELTPLQSGWFYMLDLIYVFGIYLQISTVVRHKKRLISSHSQIIIFKGKQIFTLVDIFATIPLEFLGFVMKMEDRVLLVLRLNRVLKIYRLLKLIQQAQLNVWANFLQIRLIKYSLLFFYILYFLSCLLYGITCFYDECDPQGWLTYNTALSTFLSPENITEPPTSILFSMFYTASRLLSLTWSTGYAYSILDIIIEYLIVLLGYYMFSFCFAELGACSVLQLEIKNKYQSYLKALKYFVVRTKLPPQLKKLMYNMVHCHWIYNKRYEITGPQSIIKDMPDNLKNEVLISRIVSCLKTIPLFMECEEELVWKVAGIARVDVFPPETVIMREDTLQVQLGVILRGHCQAESSIPTDKYHKCVMSYSYGNCFPLVEMLLGLDSFLRVTSITSVEVITIAKADLMVCIKSIERFHHDLEKVLKQHLETYYIILTRQKGRLPETASRQKSSGKSDYFAYDVSDVVKIDSEKKSYGDAFKKPVRWQWTKYFLLRKSIEPTRRFFVIWEISRDIVAVISTIYSLFIMKFYLKESTLVHTYVKRIFQIVFVVDLYIRMHIRYYNRKGILVTHPSYTARHYVKTSFVLDLITILPIEDLKLHTLFGARYKYHALVLICTIIKPFLLHRIFNGLNYLRNECKEGRAMFYQNINYVSLVLIILGIFANILEMATCSELSDWKMFYSCPNQSWIKHSIYRSKIEDNVYTASIICYFTVLSIFTTCTVGFFKFQTYKELVIILILTAGLLALRWFVLAKITSSRISGNSMLIHYQHDMKILLKFMKKYCVDSRLVEETVSHYEYVWKKTKEYRTTNTLRSFHKVLSDDISYYLYSPTLKLSYVLCSADESAMRFISCYFEQIHFKKNAEIIRCNDINEFIFIVNKGRVDIFVAQDRLCSLTNGGMFGCFAAQGNIRQTVTARSIVNVDVLRIKSTKFNEIISIYPKVKQKMTRGRFLKTEYMLPITTSSVSNAEINIDQSTSQIQTLQKMKAFFISPNNTLYMIYDYVTSIHVATLSSLITMTIIVTVLYSNIKIYRIYIYILDVFFLIKMFLGFHVTYMDTDTGVLIMQYSKIWRRYLRSFSGFTLDFITSFPFELVAQFFITNSKFLNFFLLNRTLRFLFMIKYYTNCKNTLTVSKHLRWTYLMYIMVLLIHLNACIWWLIACPEKKCSYYRRVGHEPYVLVEEQDTLNSFRIAFQYVINVFTTTGLRTVGPTSNGELITTVVMICVAQYILIALTVGFASMLVLDKSVMTHFECEAGHVLKYFEATNLSLSLRNKVWNYYVLLWTRGHGSWMPKLITSAPKYLREDIMYELYGKYLLEHFLFKKTHVDFLRQLVAQMELCVFLPGMYIAQKGDIDNCMYFIDSGAVIVYDISDKTEVEVQVLEEGKSFGEAQGLYGLPHEKSYKARFTSRIIVLKKQNWSYLLKWFPASKEQIEQQSGRRLRLQAISISC